MLPTGTGRTNGEISRTAVVAGVVVLQLVPSQRSKVSPTQYDGTCALTSMMSWLPRVSRIAVSSVFAKPRKPPTRIRPVGAPARASWAGVEESPASPPGMEIAPPAPALARRFVRNATVGAGSTRKTAADAAVAPERAVTRPAIEMRPPPLSAIHISTRLHNPSVTKAMTNTPKLRLIACAALAAMRPAAAPSENSRSRRAGT